MILVYRLYAVRSRSGLTYCLEPSLLNQFDLAVFDYGL